MECSETSKPELEPTVEDEKEIDRGFLMFSPEVSQIHPFDLEQFFYNGFDNPDSVELCTEQDLE
jgi:hypothetical protein